MTYFSDFDTTEYYYDDAQLRKNIINEVEEMYVEPSFETVPADLFDDPFLLDL